MKTISEWGTRPSERTLGFACDRVLPGPSDALYRGITVHASAPILYRWLCQLRVAPYSYDWIDNRGRRSPDQLTKGLDELEVGQRLAIAYPATMTGRLVRAFLPAGDLVMMRRQLITFRKLAEHDDQSRTFTRA